MWDNRNIVYCPTFLPIQSRYIPSTHIIKNTDCNVYDAKMMQVYFIIVFTGENGNCVSEYNKFITTEVFI